MKTQDPVPPTPEIPQSFSNGSGNVSGIGLRPVPASDFNISNPTINLGSGADADRWAFNGESPQPPIDMAFTADMNMGMGLDDNTFTWEMIGLGLEEPLPPQDTIDELYVPMQNDGMCAHTIYNSDIRYISTKSIPQCP